MKNQDKATATYAKQFTKKKAKSPLNLPEDFQHPKPGLVTKCKFCEKEHRPNKCWHLQAECYYCHKTGHIANFCKKKLSLKASLRQVVTCTQSLPYIFTLLEPQALASCSVNAEFPESSVQKIIIDSGATNHVFSNREYFSTYTEHHHEFQTGSAEILAANRYGDVVLRLAHSNGSEVIWTIKKVSWAPLLGHSLLSTIPLAKKGLRYCFDNFRYLRKLPIKEKFLREPILLRISMLFVQ